jgi:hypothetical protein
MGEGAVERLSNRAQLLNLCGTRARESGVGGLFMLEQEQCLTSRLSVALTEV